MLPLSKKDSRGKLNPWVCAGINQFVWPGLGSILGGRVVGFAQAALMLVGFVLFVGFMLLYFKSMYAWAADPRASEEQLHASYRPYLWMCMVGLGSCAISWVWALITSLFLMRSTPRPPPPVPPGASFESSADQR